MRLSRQQYEVLKWIVAVFTPALLVLLDVVLPALDVPYTETVLTIGAAVEVFLGSLMKQSEHVYNRDVKGK